MENESVEAYPWIALACGVGLVAFLAAAFFCLRRKRLIEDVPTSKVKGVFMGLNELKGVARCPQPLRSPFTTTPCVWFSYTIEEEYRRQERNSKGETTTKTGWQKVANQQSEIPFELEDDTGAIRVLPTRATVHPVSALRRTVRRGDPLYHQGPTMEIRGSTGRRRFVEDVVPVDAELYVLGPTRLREDVVAPEVAKDKGTFLISTKSEERLTRGYRWWALLFLVLTFACSVAIPFLLAAPDRPEPWAVGLAVGGPLLAILVFWTVMVYNGLVRVRNSQERAFSLIDVQLRRRHDLYGPLVEAARGYATHERELQERLAALRSDVPTGTSSGSLTEAAVHDASDAAAAQSASLRQVMALAEAYPSLAADEVFSRLRVELVDTEDRIALAREFFNSSVRAMHDRARVFPASLLARLGRFDTSEYFAADGLERATSAVGQL